MCELGDVNSKLCFQIELLKIASMWTAQLHLKIDPNNAAHPVNRFHGDGRDGGDGTKYVPAVKRTN